MGLWSRIKNTCGCSARKPDNSVNLDDSMTSNPYDNMYSIIRTPDPEPVKGNFWVRNSDKISQTCLISEVQAKPRRSPTIPPRRKKSINEIESTAYIAHPSELSKAEPLIKTPLGKTISNPIPHKLAQVTYSDAYVKKAEEIS